MEKDNQSTIHAICNVCKQAMDPNCGCEVERYELGGKYYERIKVGDDDYLHPSATLCHDCNAGAGQYHHVGCAIERCPICHDQFFICGCVPDAYILKR